MEFVFQTGPCSRSELIPQLAQALDLRMESISRKKQPRLWKSTDKLRENQTEELLQRKQKKNRILGIIFLIVGVILAVPGILAQTGLNAPLIGGIMASIVGVTYLTPQTQEPSRRMTTLAQKLLNMRNTGPTGEICFGTEGLNVNGGSVFPYTKIESVVETQELYLLVLANGAMFLLKEECIEGDPDAFSAFLKEQLAEKYISAS